MIIYFLVALFATIAGSAFGLGGGVILKPAFDMLGHYDVATITILSSITVLSMAVVSTVKYVIKGFDITKSIAFTTVGAIIGGIVGSIIFNMLLAIIAAPLITVIQSFTLIGLLVVCLFYEKIPVLDIGSLPIYALAGLTLGLLSSLLGIGGGPINVTVLCVLFGIDLRQSAKVSIFIILFSQLAGLITKAIDGTLVFNSDMNVILYMIPAAIIGGFVGCMVNRNLASDKLDFMYKSLIVLVIVICMYNAVRNLVLI